MSAQVSIDVRSLFAELGIAGEYAAAARPELVIDRFEQWSDRALIGAGPARTCCCHADLPLSAVA